MAEDGHAPTFGSGNRLYKIGQKECPECGGDLHPSGESGLACINDECEAFFPVGRMGP